MRTFKRLCNVSRRYVLRLAKIAALLNKEFKNEKPSCFDLSNQEHAAVNKLKSYLIEPLVLALARASRHYMGNTDKSYFFSGVCFVARAAR